MIVLKLVVLRQSEMDELVEVLPQENNGAVSLEISSEVAVSGRITTNVRNRFQRFERMTK
jgi:hypothetical protein